MKWQSLAWICAGLFAALACGQATSSTGSNTNWLSPCVSDAGCSDGLSCLCGVCTARCSSASSCGEQNAVCATVSSAQCAGAEPAADRVCLKGCTENGECGAERACVDGACQRKSAVEPPPPRGPVELAVSGGHICLAREGKVWCWGGNGMGETGQPPLTPDADEPHEVAGLSGVVELAARYGNTCARTEAGRVFCWGANWAGQVGPVSAPALTCYKIVLDRGTMDDEPCQPTPTEVPGIDGAVQLALADAKSCARLSDGTVSCWGDISNEVAEFTAGLNDVRDLTLSNSGLCAVLGDGSVTCSDASMEPSWKTDFASAELSAVGNVLCTRKSDGRVDCWGDNQSGQLGIGFAFPSVTYPLFPAAVTKGATQVALGVDHGCALIDDGSVQCWGDSEYGEVGISPEATALCPDGGSCQSPPRVVTGLPKMVALAAAQGVACAIAEDASLWCWGGPIGNLLRTGAPLRIAGPWQDAPSACVSAEQTVMSALVAAQTAAATDVGCLTDADCTEIPLEIACFHGCSSGPLNKRRAARLEDALATAAKTTCTGVAKIADCSAPGPACATPPGKLECFGGTCVRFDPEATGLGSVCEYAAVKQAMHVTTPTCAESDLYVASTWPCAGCGSSLLYVVLGNSGQRDFDGEATIEPIEEANAGETAVPAPPPLTQHFTIPSGGLSPAVTFPYRDHRGLVRLRVNGPGSCNSAGDEGTFAETPDFFTCPPE